MQKLIKYIKTHAFIFIALVLSLTTFYKMFMPGIYSMQDFHFFRQYEFNKCVELLQIPCRWAPDAGLGYGEPLFNFYGQFPYAIGEIYYLLSGSIIDSVKFLFMISLAGSVFAMFILAKEIWKNNYSALISSLIYVYAPYRAVDVWVRGALPEAFAFIFFPLIILSIEKKNIFYFSLSVSLLIITHNLSFIMFLPFLIVWIIYRKWWQAFLGLVAAGLLSSFYILPVIFESKFIDLLSTTQGYFDFRAHFITLKQIFFDQSWGYGGSAWGSEDGLNLSVGIVQWLIPLFTLSMMIYRYIIIKEKKIDIKYSAFCVLFFLGLFYLFLTHNKSTFVWVNLPLMSFIQFPWRFLGVAVFCLSLAAGLSISLVKNKLFRMLIFILVITYSLFTIHYFKPDIWYRVNDDYFITGEEWVRQRTASIGDYWPKFDHKIPSTPSNGKYINYFPGWVSSSPIENGLILKDESYFKDTPVRVVGNIISMVTLIGFVFISLRTKKWEKRA